MAKATSSSGSKSGKKKEKAPKWRDQLKEISPEQMEDIRKVFKMYDKNSDGWINVYELTHVMQMLGNNPTPKYMREIMKEADKDGNGKLDFDEFALLLSKYLKPQEEEELELEEAFSVFDKDNSGTIELAELREILKTAKVHIPERQLQEIFEELDTNGDGRLDYKEFSKIATQSCFRR